MLFEKLGDAEKIYKELIENKEVDRYITEMFLDGTKVALEDKFVYVREYDLDIRMAFDTAGIPYIVVYVGGDIDEDYICYYKDMDMVSAIAKHLDKDNVEVANLYCEIYYLEFEDDD